MSEDTANVNFTLRGVGGDVQIRTWMLGDDPVIVIEPNEDGDFDVDITGLSQEEAGQLFAGLSRALLEETNEDG